MSEPFGLEDMRTIFGPSDQPKFKAGVFDSIVGEVKSTPSALARPKSKGELSKAVIVYLDEALKLKQQQNEALLQVANRFQEMVSAFAPPHNPPQPSYSQFQFNYSPIDYSQFNPSQFYSPINHSQFNPSQLQSPNTPAKRQKFK
jgi:hypothetical protein